MCTLTYLPLNRGAILTSSRDEKYNREPGLAPSCRTIGDSRLYAPTDTRAGGTWFMVSDLGMTGILLNGAHSPHIPLPVYRKSRGVVLSELFETGRPVEALARYDLDGIENFTLLLYTGTRLFQGVWDGTLLDIKTIDIAVPHIWSSVTLYSSAMAAERKKWFDNWLGRQQQFRQQAILDFHSNAGRGNREFGLRMDRTGLVRTVSITSVRLENEKARMVYQDCLQGGETVLQIPVRVTERALLKN